MDPQRPFDAQRIVSEYAAALERHQLDGVRLPAPVDTLPYSRDAIRQSIRVTAETLHDAGQMTDELREFLQLAYVSLADYIDAELVRLMDEYREATAEYAADGRLGRERTDTPAWRRLAETGALVGRIAQAMADDAAGLRREFDTFVPPEPGARPRPPHASTAKGADR